MTTCLWRGREGRRCRDDDEMQAGLLAALKQLPPFNLAKWAFGFLVHDSTQTTSLVPNSSSSRRNKTKENRKGRAKFKRIENSQEDRAASSANIDFDLLSLFSSNHSIQSFFPLLNPHSLHSHILQLSLYWNRSSR